MMDTTSIVYISLEVLIGVLAIMGNSLVLAAIHQSRRLQTVTNCFIASLALADLLVGIIVAPLAALSYLGKPEGFMGCVFTNSVVVMFTQISIFSLVAVAIERFIAINKPFFYQQYMTIRNSILIIVGTWIAAIVTGLVPLYGWNMGPDGWDHVCNFVKVIDMKFMVYFNFFGFVLTPLVIMLALYSYIFYIVQDHMAKITALEIVQEQESTKRRKQFKRDVKAAKSLAMVVVIFAVCWLPIHILNSIDLFTNHSNNMYLLLTAILLSHLNSAINPFLYAIGNANYQIAFKRMFCRRCIPNIMTSEEEHTFTNPKRLQGNVSKTVNSSSELGYNNKSFVPDNSHSKNYRQSNTSNQVWTVSVSNLQEDHSLSSHSNNAT